MLVPSVQAASSFNYLPPIGSSLPSTQSQPLDEVLFSSLQTASSVVSLGTALQPVPLYDASGITQSLATEPGLLGTAPTLGSTLGTTTGADLAANTDFTLLPELATLNANVQLEQDLSTSLGNQPLTATTLAEVNQPLLLDSLLSPANDLLPPALGSDNLANPLGLVQTTPNDGLALENAAVTGVLPATVQTDIGSVDATLANQANSGLDALAVANPALTATVDVAATTASTQALADALAATAIAQPLIETADNLSATSAATAQASVAAQPLAANAAAGTGEAAATGANAAAAAAPTTTETTIAATPSAEANITTANTAQQAAQATPAAQATEAQATEAQAPVAPAQANNPTDANATLAIAMDDPAYAAAAAAFYANAIAARLQAGAPAIPPSPQAVLPVGATARVKPVAAVSSDQGTSGGLLGGRAG